MLDILESIHNAGFVYNDLKLDNLMLDYGLDERILRKTNEDIFDQHKVNIIDFDFATTYVDHKTLKHKTKKKTDVFLGSMIFSSSN